MSVLDIRGAIPVFIYLLFCKEKKVDSARLHVLNEH